jgi:putative transposase
MHGRESALNTGVRAARLMIELFFNRGTPKYNHSDKGPEFTPRTVQRWLSQLRLKIFYIEPGSQWENSYIEFFNGKVPG